MALNGKRRSRWLTSHRGADGTQQEKEEPMAHFTGGVHQSN